MKSQKLPELAGPIVIYRQGDGLLLAVSRNEFVSFVFFFLRGFLGETITQNVNEKILLFFLFPFLSTERLLCWKPSPQELISSFKG